MVLPPPPGARKVRKQLSADALYALLGESFARIPDHRQPTPPIPLPDALLSAFAMFALKDPSLLAFDQRRSDGNLKAAVRHRADSQRHADAGDSRPAGPRAPAACLRRRVSPVAARQGPGTVRVLQRRLSAVAGRHRILLVAEDPLSVVPGEGAQGRDGDLRASDARCGDRPSRHQGGDPPGAGADSETGRQHQERLRAECGPSIVGENPPGTSAIEADRRRGWAGQQRSPRAGPDRLRHALHPRRQARGSCVFVRAGGGRPPARALSQTHAEGRERHGARCPGCGTCR